MIHRIKNFFLTGKIKVGKTTVLNKVLKNSFFDNLTIKGYKTKPLVDNSAVKGYTFETLNGVKEIFAHVNLLSSEKFDRYRTNPQIFDDLGVKTLKNAIINGDIILMDEIGVIENKAQKFKKMVLKCLNSTKLTMGVFQQRTFWFTDLILKRQDTLIFEITENNRDTIHFEIIKKIYENSKIILTN